MTVHIKSSEPRNTPYEDLEWSEAGQVVPVEDPAIAADLLRIPGFTEVPPEEHGRHEAVTEPGPDAAAQAEAEAEAKAATDAAAAEEEDKKTAAKGSRGKAVTE